MENPRGLPSYTIVWFWLALAADQFLLQLLFFAHQLTVLISKGGAARLTDDQLRLKNDSSDWGASLLNPFEQQLCRRFAELTRGVFDSRQTRNALCSVGNVVKSDDPEVDTRLAA